MVAQFFGWDVIHGELYATIGSYLVQYCGTHKAPTHDEVREVALEMVFKMTRPFTHSKVVCLASIVAANRKD